MAAYTLAQAAAATGRNRSSILRAIKAGRLSAERDSASEEWRIEPAELHRLYAAVEDTGANPVRPSGAQAAAQVEIRELRAQLSEIRATVADLRARLDEERADRRLAQMQLGEALQQVRALTDQRPARRLWWRWGRTA